MTQALHKLKGRTYAEDMLNERLDVGVEIDTGKFYLGKRVYRMLVAIAAGPANEDKYFAHGISNIDQVIKLQGVMKTDSVPNWFPIPYAVGSNQALEVEMESVNIRLSSLGSYSDAHGFVEVEYTHS